MGDNRGDRLATAINGGVETRVLILCAGDGERWGEYLGGPKQLAPIGGRPLLVRTVDQVEKQFGVLPVIVTQDPRLHVTRCQSFYPERRRWVVETFLSTRRLWSLRTVVLLGDVLYTDGAMATFLQNAVGLVIFGRRGASAFSGKRYGELFGVSFTRQYHEFVVDCLDHVIADAEGGARGKLWDFCFFAEAHQLPRLQPATFCEIHDYTEDFDSPQEYRYLKRLYEWAISPSPVLRTLALMWSVFFCAPCATWHRWKQWRHDRWESRRRRRGMTLFPDEIPPYRRAA